MGARSLGIDGAELAALRAAVALVKAHLRKGCAIRPPWELTQAT